MRKRILTLCVLLLAMTAMQTVFAALYYNIKVGGVEVNSDNASNITGSRIKVFRLFAILPLTYEIVCIVLKTLAANRTVELSPYLYPFLTTKPPVAFLLFIVLALFLKIRERRYLRSGKTREEYAAGKAALDCKSAEAKKP